jgi:hypothetical protein
MVKNLLPLTATNILLAAIVLVLLGVVLGALLLELEERRRRRAEWLSEIEQDMKRMFKRG